MCYNILNRQINGAFEMNDIFFKINKKLGFGMMRLPMNGKDVDIETTKEMVDYFIDNGFNYFDTAHGYPDGKSYN